ncbi:MAG TPA: methyltransferase domain-containing protein [Anaerolineaceae bacterium]|nr:methyltransferase domain-containing protein [Anaerolineaceae bacterium]
MNTNTPSDTPPVCDYTDSDYQQSFWESGNRRYEDAVEEIAIKRLLNRGGKLLIELGAGAGRNTKRYTGFDRVVLVDYSRTQLLQARERLGEASKYIYVAADIYKLPFVAGLFDGATMIRTLHHFSEVPSAFREVRRVMAESGLFILEFANKRNLKAIARYLLRKQDWNPFDLQPVEFVKLNYDFHPRYIWSQLQVSGFAVEDRLAVSRFRADWFKRHIKHDLLVKMDAALQFIGRFSNTTPSVFTRLSALGSSPIPAAGEFFACPACGQALPESQASLTCPQCGHAWEYKDGIYEFRLNP